jgi:hypothetical protein
VQTPGTSAIQVLLADACRGNFKQFGLLTTTRAPGPIFPISWSLELMMCFVLTRGNKLYAASALANRLR